ncbi:MAG TPA: alpha/beta hydrolase-fold protein, partial [Gemmatimonadales bacterium]|nr:alpha/beta hydrolase-fold protein [Gemmatimonadales bacterium]
PELDNRRDVLVCLPPSYRESRRSYPVVYMHDGQNLFDAEASFAGDWGMRRILASAARRGLEPIVVGVPNLGPARLDEYSPYHDEEAGGGGRGAAYAAFVAGTLKRLVDRRFRTRRGRAHTAIAGSSMGGLISLYAFFRHPAVFGAAGVLSPSLWFAGGAIFSTIERAEMAPGRIYLDIGATEGERHVANARRMRELLVAKGYRPDRELRWLESRTGRHDERSWGRRFARALPFLVTTP